MRKMRTTSNFEEVIIAYSHDFLSPGHGHQYIRFAYVDIEGKYLPIDNDCTFFNDTS